MSVFGEILTAVESSLASIPAIAAVKLRKKLILLEGDPRPIVIVAPGRNGERVSGQQFARGVWYDYPVLVAYVQNAGAAVDLDQTFLDVRESIRNQLVQVVLPGVSSVFDTFWETQEANEFAAKLVTSYDVTGFLIWYRSSEKRSS